MLKHPVEAQVLKLLKEGLGDAKVAKRVGTTPNHVWAIRAASGLKPVTKKQLAIARRIVERKRQEAPARMAATLGPKRAVKPRARSSSK